MCPHLGGVATSTLTFEQSGHKEETYGMAYKPVFNV